MKRKILGKVAGILLSAAFMGLVAPATVAFAAPNEDGSVNINEENFPDATFRAYVEAMEGAEDGVLTAEELAAVGTIDVRTSGITSLKGVEYFTSLKHLHCEQNELTELDVTALTELELLWCYENQLTQLDVSNNKELYYLTFGGNNVSEIDVTMLEDLQIFYCDQNQLTELDVTKNAKLYDLWCYDNPLTELDVTQNPKLKRLFCYEDGLSELNLENNTALEILWCNYNKLSDLNVSNSTALSSLDFSGNQCLSLDLSALGNLQNVHLGALDTSCQQVLNLGNITADGINIKAYDESIDLNKITNVQGATYDAATGMLTGYTNEAPITYTYKVVDANGTEHNMDVELQFAVEVVVAPSADVAPGNYTDNQTVSLSTDTKEATIYYTTDGSDPTTSGEKYDESILVTGEEGSAVTTIIKAIAVKDGCLDSEVITFVYTIELQEEEPAPEPEEEEDDEDEDDEDEAEVEDSKEPEYVVAPKTGESNTMIWLLVVAMLFTGAFATLLVKNKR